MKKNKSGFVRLAKLMAPYHAMLLLCLLCVIVANVAQILNPIFAEKIIDDFLIAKKPQSGLYSIAGLAVSYFLVELIGAVGSVCQSRCMARMSQSILHDMRVTVFDKIMNMSMRVIDKNGTGRLITRATNDVETINEFYSDVFINLFKDVFLLIGILIMMAAMNFKLALVSFTGIPLIFLISFSLKKVIKENFKKVKRTIGKINGFISENINGMKIVQAYNRQKDKYDEFETLNDEYFKGTFTQVVLNSFLRPAMEIINNLVIALLIAYSIGGIENGVLEVGVLYAFTNYVKKFFDPINDLAEKYTSIQSAFVSVDRIYEVLDETDCDNLRGGTYRAPVKGEVEFQHVWFAYNDENWILKDVSFKLHVGQKAAFVGATGAGKSTIINLISGYYLAQKGRILVDGVAVEDWDIKALREGVTTVQQDVFLFAGNIRDNIRMRTALPDDAVQKALHIAHADTFVNGEDCLEDPVTEQGLNFSTGQRQLLSFARAVAADPAVLVLDEATAHIDSNTEEVVQRSIVSISQNRTCIFIAHRLSTIRSCDVIFVIDHGRILESGTHDALYAQKGRYYQLVQAAEETTQTLSC